MNEENPYSAPKSETNPKSAKPTRRRKFLGLRSVVTLCIQWWVVVYGDLNIEVATRPGRVFTWAFFAMFALGTAGAIMVAADLELKQTSRCYFSIVTGSIVYFSFVGLFIFAEPNIIPLITWLAIHSAISWLITVIFLRKTFDHTSFETQLKD